MRNRAHGRVRRENLHLGVGSLDRRAIAIKAPGVQRVATYEMGRLSSPKHEHTIGKIL